MQVSKGDDARGALHADADRENLELLCHRVKDPQPKRSSNRDLHQTQSRSLRTQCMPAHCVKINISTSKEEGSLPTCLEGTRPAPLPNAWARTELQRLIGVTPMKGGPGLRLKLPYGAGSSLPALDGPIAGVAKDELVADGDDLQQACLSCVVKEYNNRQGLQSVRKRIIPI